MVVNRVPSANGESGGGGWQVVVPAGGTQNNQIIPYVSPSSNNQIEIIPPVNSTISITQH